MNRPPADNARRVIEYIRRHGSVIYRRVPDDFLDWRLGLRRQARLHGMRVSVRRGPLGWVVENPDWHISRNDIAPAVAMLPVGSDARDLADNESARRRARHGLRLVPNERDEPAPKGD